EPAVGAPLAQRTRAAAAEVDAVPLQHGSDLGMLGDQVGDRAGDVDAHVRSVPPRSTFCSTGATDWTGKTRAIRSTFAGRRSISERMEHPHVEAVGCEHCGLVPV